MLTAQRPCAIDPLLSPMKASPGEGKTESLNQYQPFPARREAAQHQRLHRGLGPDGLLPAPGLPARLRGQFLEVPSQEPAHLVA